MFNRKAQGAIEYLLIVGVAILVVAVVVIAITSITSSANQNMVGEEKVDSIYKGLTDVIDASKSTVFLIVRLNEGENSLVFQSELSSNTLKDLFEELPINSEIKFNNSTNCGVVDANKKETVWEPNSIEGYRGDNTDASECIVSSFSQIIITVPEDTNLEVKENISEEPIVLDDNSYIINNCYELQNMKNDLSGDYVLGENIDCSLTKNWNDGNGFEPIGKYPGAPFIGNFDGNNYTISNLTINRPTESNVGLFGYCVFSGHLDRNISNVNLVEVSITGNNYIGGLVGASNNSYLIKNIFVSGEINGISNVGGLIGSLKKGSIYYSSTNTNIVAESNNVGSLVGYSNEMSIYQSYSVGNVIGGINVGGLIGYDVNSSHDNLYSHSNVSGKNNVGGLIGGYVQLQKRDLNSSYSTGSIKINDVESCALLVGSYNTNERFNDLYWNNTSCDSLSLKQIKGSTWLSLNEMKNVEMMFNNLDSNNLDVWEIEEGEYPTLKNN